MFLQNLLRSSPVSILDTAQLCDMDASSKSHNFEKKNAKE
jgi:hypothetical protein